MDRTELYIKMCGKAEKIQALAPKEGLPDRHKWCWDDRQGSVFWLPEEKEFVLYHWDNDEGHFIIGGYHSKLDGMVWLPRQDQLSAMLDELEWSLHKWTIPVLGYQMYISFMDDMVIDHADTVEQALLRMVMLFKHKNVWNGEDWEAT